MSIDPTKLSWKNWGREVWTVSFTRKQLPSVLALLRERPDTAPVLIGRYRKPDGVLMSYEAFEALMDLAEAAGLGAANIGGAELEAVSYAEAVRRLAELDPAKADASTNQGPCCGHTYLCPTAKAIECGEHGGFDVCCAHPELHVPIDAAA